MYFSSFVALFLVLATSIPTYAKPTGAASSGAPANSTETETNITDVFPVSDLDAGHFESDKDDGTLGGRSVAADSPATLLLCSDARCISCTSFDLSTILHDRCISFGFTYNSVAIFQPNDDGFSFGVFAGTSCAEFGLVPAVNTCFNTPNFSTIKLSF